MMEIENLSRKGKILYDYIAENGSLLDEWKLRDATGLSHGSFCAARKELVEAGLLVLGKDGRKTTYKLTCQPDTSKADRSNTDIPSEPAPADTPAAASNAMSFSRSTSMTPAVKSPRMDPPSNTNPFFIRSSIPIS